jgi:hypothetical protein
MTLSDAHRTAAIELLERCAACVDESELVRQIDEPISQAMVTFRFDQNVERTPRTFLHTVSSFLRHLHATAFPHGRQFSESQARDEAVAFLERVHPSHGTSGFDQALWDAIDPAGPGWEVTLALVADLLKAHLRDACIRAIFARHLDVAAPLTRCAMAVVLVERCRDCLPRPLLTGPVERLVNHIADLLTIDLATHRQATGTTDQGLNPFG